MSCIANTDCNRGVVRAATLVRISFSLSPTLVKSPLMAWVVTYCVRFASIGFTKGIWLYLLIMFSHTLSAPTLLSDSCIYGEKALTKAEEVEFFR